MGTQERRVQLIPPQRTRGATNSITVYTTVVFELSTPVSPNETKNDKNLTSEVHFLGFGRTTFTHLTFCRSWFPVSTLFPIKYRESGSATQLTGFNFRWFLRGVFGSDLTTGFTFPSFVLTTIKKFDNSKFHRTMYFCLYTLFESFHRKYNKMTYRRKRKVVRVYL